MGPEGIPGLTPEMMAQAEAEMGMGPQGAPAPQGQAPMAAPSEEELMAILEALQTGELTPEDLPPEIMQMLDEFLASQQGPEPQMAPPMAPEMAPEGEIPQEILAILEALQSGEITPEQIPPELMQQILPFLEGGM
jgi:hypothetical protein